MGKRKHLEENYHLCDYTCYPLDTTAPKRYLPLWKSDRVVKTGTYVTWEAVVSHILYMKAQQTKPAAMGDLSWDAEKSLQLVHEAAGRPVLPGPEYKDLTHFKDDGLPQSLYMHKCSQQRAPISTVAITIMGDTCLANDYQLSADVHGSYKTSIESFFGGKDYNIIKPTRKVKGLPKFKELVVMTLVDNDMQLNKKAKQLFRMNLYGPVLLGCNNKEENGLLEFTMDQYKTAFDIAGAPLKRSAAAAAPSSDVHTQESFETVSKDLKDTFDDLVQKETQDAHAPKKRPKVNKKINPPPVSRQVAVSVEA